MAFATARGREHHPNRPGGKAFSAEVVAFGVDLLDNWRRACLNCDMLERRYETMTDALRECLASDPRSFADVSRQTGLARTSLMAFADGSRSLRLDLADILAEFYGLTVVEGTK